MHQKRASSTRWVRLSGYKEPRCQRSRGVLPGFSRFCHLNQTSVSRSTVAESARSVNCGLSFALLPGSSAFPNVRFSLFFVRLQETPHSLARFFRYPAGFRNFIPKHAFTRYCWLTTDSLVKRDHGPPAGGRRAFTPRAGRSLWRRPRVRHKERGPLWPTCAAARLLVTRRKSEAIDGLEADENRADVVSLAGPS